LGVIGEGGQQQVLVGTVDGSVSAMDGETGEALWTFKSGSPLVSSSRTPVSPGDGRRGPSYVIPGTDGSLFALRPSSAGPGVAPTLERLPASVQDLVAASPSITTDGAVVLGARRTVVYALNPRDGRLLREFSDSPAFTEQEFRAGLMGLPPVCGAAPCEWERLDQGRQKEQMVVPIYVGRTEHVVRSVDKNTGLERWNVTYAKLAHLPPGQLFGGAFFNPEPELENEGGARSHPGLIQVSFGGRNTLKVKGGVDLTAMEEWTKGFTSTPMFASVVDVATGRIMDSVASTPDRKALGGGNSSPGRVLVGAHRGGLYAIGSNHLEMLGHKVQQRPMLGDGGEGVNPGSGSKYGEDRPMGTALVAVPAEGEDDWQEPVEIEEVPPNEYSSSVDWLPETEPGSDVALEEEIQDLSRQVNRSRKTLLSLLLSLLLVVPAVYFLARHRALDWAKKNLKLKKRNRGARSGRGKGEGKGEGSPAAAGEREAVEGPPPTPPTPPEGTVEAGAGEGRRGSAGGESGDWEDWERKQVSKLSESRETSDYGNPSDLRRRPVEEFLPDGRRITRVGRMIVGPDKLGTGSAGTVVYEGELDGRKVAVKRILQQFYDLARKEIDALIASDEHPNVVRCFAMEEDGDFLYLALERCNYNLNDYILAPGTKTKLIDLKTGLPTPHCMEIMRDIVNGLAFLHTVGIVHRDLKPQNVLLTPALKAKVSDMGLSKQLGAEQSSFEGTGFGSAGWQAAEVLRRDGSRLTRSVDIFSLGCVLFYCMTGGEHPYGVHYERDGNIMLARPRLRSLGRLPVALNMIRIMISVDPSQRPSSAGVAAHPFWWSGETSLNFLMATSNFMENHDRMPDQGLLQEFESYSGEAFGKEWDKQLGPLLNEDGGKFRRYNWKTLRDLLRIIRNKYSHFRELPTTLQEMLGSQPETYFAYFRERFPGLLLACFKFGCLFLSQEPDFKKYFPAGSKAMFPFVWQSAPAAVVKKLVNGETVNLEFKLQSIDKSNAVVAGGGRRRAGSSGEREAAQESSKPLPAGFNFARNPGMLACAYYMKTGSCKYGKECRFDHPPEYFVARNSSGMPLRPGEPVCEHFVKNGRCKYGEACKYHHPEPGGKKKLESERKREPEKPKAGSGKSKAEPEKAGPGWKSGEGAGSKPAGEDAASSATGPGGFATDSHAWPTL